MTGIMPRQLAERIWLTAQRIIPSCGLRRYCAAGDLSEAGLHKIMARGCAEDFPPYCCRCFMPIPLLIDLSVF